MNTVQNNSMDDRNAWVRWQRYVLWLTIDGGKPVFLGRLMMRKSAEKVVERLKVYKGYELKIVDTKVKHAD